MNLRPFFRHSVFRHSFRVHGGSLRPVHKRSRPAALRSPLLALALLWLAGLSSASAHAQALSTASRSLDIAAFGGFTYGSTDYANFTGQGAAFGLDITRYFHLPIVPSFEARTNVLHSTALNEDSYLGGLKLELPLTRHTALHPYADVLVGAGILHFKFPVGPGYDSDRSRIFSYGGGLDLDLGHHLQAKLDGQYQTWNLGPNGVVVPSGGNFTITPTILTIGVEYHIPFRPHIRQSDFYSGR